MHEAKYEDIKREFIAEEIVQQNKLNHVCHMQQ